MSADGLPLAGVRVVEAATFVSGPFAAMMLGDLGADVVKVEPPDGGDFFRHFGARPGALSAGFINVNRNKRSVGIDLATDDGREQFLALLAESDVLVANWRQESAARLGLSDPAVAARNPRLIRAYVSGYGTTGPSASEPAFDPQLQARSGLSYVQGNGDEPGLVASVLADKVAAVFASQAVLAALIRRGADGAGERLDVSMLDALAYFNFPDVFSNRTLLPDDGADTNPLIQTARALRTQDGWIAVTAILPGQRRGLIDAVGEPEWAELRSAELRERLAAAVLSEPTDHWLARLRAAGVPCSPVHTLDDHLADDQVAANAIYSITDMEGIGPVRWARYPAVSSAWGTSGVREPAPIAVGSWGDERTARPPD